MTSESLYSFKIENNKIWLKPLLDYFINIKFHNDNIEKIREDLSSIPDFSPQQLFSTIDKDQTNYISYKNLITFLTEMNTSFYETYVRSFIHNYDKQKNFSINYSQFLSLILPHKNLALKEKILNGHPKDNSSNENKIKSLFNELIKEELKLAETSYKIAIDILSSETFTTYEAFLEIVKNGKYITQKKLATFLNENNIENFDEKDVELLMMRIDSDNDDKISYDEFVEIFLPLSQRSENYIQKLELYKSNEKNENKLDENKNKKNNITRNRGNNINYIFNYNYSLKDRSVSNDNKKTKNNSTSRSKRKFSDKTNFTLSTISINNENNEKFNTCPDKFYIKNEEPKKNMNDNNYFSPRIDNTDKKKDKISSEEKTNDETKLNCSCENKIYNNIISDKGSPSNSTIINNSQNSNQLFSYLRNYPVDFDRLLKFTKYNNQNMSENENFNSFFEKNNQNLTIKNDAFYNLICDYLEQDSITQNILESLCLCEDFNIPNLFELFTANKIQNQDIITSSDIYDILINNLCFYIEPNDIFYIFAKFNKNINDLNNCTLNFENFCEIFTPKKYSIIKVMKERNENKYFMGFSFKTKRILVSLFKQFIDSEKSNERYRRELLGEINGENKLNLYITDLYKALSNPSYKGIIKEDIIRFMEVYGRILDPYEIDSIMERFDKNKDGFIDVSEFKQEILPKLNL